MVCAIVLKILAVPLPLSYALVDLVSKDGWGRKATNTGKNGVYSAETLHAHKFNTDRIRRARLLIDLAMSKVGKKRLGR